VGAGTRLIPASAAESRKHGRRGRAFSEEDLTRYLQITLDVFRDLQYSLQPRLHLEIGAGRLTSIEEALAGMGGAGVAPAAPKAPPAAPRPASAAPAPVPTAAPPAPVSFDDLPPWPSKTEPTRRPAPSAPAAAPPAPSVARPAPAPNPPAASAAPAPVRAGDGSLRDRLHAGLLEAGLKFTADAIEASTVTEHPAEVEIVAPEELQLSLNEKELQQFLARLGVTKRIRLRFSDTVVAAPAPRAAAPDAQEQEVMGRALAHPMVQRFQETFKDSQSARCAIQAMMKQAQQMQQRLQEEIAAIRVEASAGGGMVTVKMDGRSTASAWSSIPKPPATPKCSRTWSRPPSMKPSAWWRTRPRRRPPACSAAWASRRA
jgi:DNA polymerase III subunit gamma/tau